MASTTSTFSFLKNNFKMAERAKKRPRIGFFDLGLKKGDVLYYKENPEIEVRVESQRQVTYQGNVTFLSSMARARAMATRCCCPPDR